MKYHFVNSAALLFLSSCVVSQKDVRPNIVFIQCDQLSYKALSCYGGPVETTNIDFLAKNGVMFTQAICTTPSSTPSRASIVTGLFPHQNGITNNIPTQPGINNDDITTDKLLNAAGYDTHHYGKWHLENDNPRIIDLSYYPDPYNFEYDYHLEFQEKYIKLKEHDQGDWMNFYGFQFPVELSAYFKSIQPRLDKKWEKMAFSDFAKKIGKLRMDENDWHDEVCTRKTIETLNNKKNSKKPFAITCSFIWPHDPNFAHEPYYSYYNPHDIKLPEITHIEEMFKKNWGHQMVKEYGEEGLREFLRIYYGTVKYLDDKVGEIVTTLKNNGQYDNTIIVFTADHGDMMGNHSMVWKSTEAFYDDIVKIPLIIHYPKKIKSKVSNAQVNVIDFMPTFLDYAKIKIPENIAGKSLLPLLSDKEKCENFRTYNICERIRPNPNKVRKVTDETTGDFMIKNEEWKYSVYSNGTEFLYNLKVDHSEIKNLANNSLYAEKKEIMRHELKIWLFNNSWRGKNMVLNQTTD